MAERARPGTLLDIQEAIVSCRRCPRLVAWREKVAAEKRASYSGETYWGRPVPGFGDPLARMLVVGLAPAAHGANRTGRMFTGDRSGDWLYQALYRAGFANQPDSQKRNDGLTLTGCYITAAVRCAPPANKPTPSEQDACGSYLEAELQLLPDIRVMVALGKFAYDQLFRTLLDRGHTVPRPRPAFSHGLEVPAGKGLSLLASYHPSQQNTFTGTLTEEMFDAVWLRARAIVDS
ncbi:uracil-DNA glycosylase [Gemmatimonadota bacterium]